MTTRPRLRLGSHLLPGLAAIALFVVFALTFLSADFVDPAAGFDAGVSITASIGYALFNLGVDGATASEGFLAAFEIIDVVLIAALAGAVMLARRESGGLADALATDGGRDDTEGGDR